MDMGRGCAEEETEAGQGRGSWSRWVKRRLVSVRRR